MKNSVFVELAAGTPTFGWCDKCLLPSVVTFSVNIISKDGVSTIGEITTCDHCEAVGA